MKTLNLLVLLLTAAILVPSCKEEDEGTPR